MLKKIKSHLKKTNEIGLFDIDERNLRLLIIKETEKKLSIIDQLEFSKHDNLSTLLKTIKTKTRIIETGLLLRDCQVMTKNFPLNIKLNKKDVNKFLALNIGKEFQHSLSETIYRYEWLTNASTPVLRVVSTKKSLIHHYTQLFLNAGLQLKTIDVESLVVERLMNVVYAPSLSYVVFLFREQFIVQFFIMRGVIKIVQDLAVDTTECDSHTLALMQRFYRVCCEYQAGQPPEIILCGGNESVTKSTMKFFKLSDVQCSSFDSKQLQTKFYDADNEINNQIYLLCYGLLLRKFS